MGNVPSIPAGHSNERPNDPPSKVIYQAQRPAPLNATPCPDANGIIIFQVQVYIQSGIPPRKYRVRAMVGKPVALGNTPIFEGLLNGDPFLALQKWDEEVELWTWVRRDEVTLCIELGDAIDRQQFARAGPDRSKWEVIDLRVRHETRRLGPDFMVFAWGAPGDDPKLFIIQLTRGGEIILADHPLLAKHLGFDSEDPEKNSPGYRAWDTSTSTWTFNHQDEIVVPPIGTDFAILRHGDNPVVMSLGFFLNRFDVLRSRPAPRSKIDLPALQMNSRPVAAPEVVAQAQPLPGLPTTPRRSPRNHKHVDYRKANIQGLDTIANGSPAEKTKQKRPLPELLAEPEHNHKRAATGTTAAAGQSGSSTGSKDTPAKVAKRRQRAKDKVERFTTRKADGRVVVDLERMLDADRRRK